MSKDMNQSTQKCYWSCEANIYIYNRVLTKYQLKSFRAAGYKSHSARSHNLSNLWRTSLPFCVRGVFYSFQPAMLVYQTPFPFWKAPQVPTWSQATRGELQVIFVTPCWIGGWENSIFFWVGFLGVTSKCTCFSLGCCISSPQSATGHFDTASGLTAPLCCTVLLLSPTPWLSCENSMGCSIDHVGLLVVPLSNNQELHVFHFSPREVLSPNQFWIYSARVFVSSFLLPSRQGVRFTIFHWIFLTWICFTKMPLPWRSPSES